MKAAIFALASALTLTGTAFADVSKVQEHYVPGAFSSADDDWRRLVINRTNSCGKVGSSDQNRVDILIARYDALGEALSSGDEAATTEAARSLGDTIKSSGRYEECWDEIARKQGIRSSLKRQLQGV